ncbi:MAG: ABC transporter permease, partial [Acidobacteria bacterium]|nr:ABC transporter permease [Acidobacteriota bacterium]
RGWRLLASTARMGDSGTALRLSVLLLSIAGLVVLIACTNVALLLLAQAEGRRHEIAIRLALGADRGRLARQLLTESAPLVLASTGAALLMAHWTIPLLPALLPPGPDFVRFDVRLDGRVVLVTLAACALANVLFGLAPWLQASRTDLNSLLKGAVWETRRRFFGRGVLVAMQAALAVVLITSAGLLARSFLVSQSQPLGFDSGKKMLMLVVGLISPRAQMAAACGQITERIRSLPGVRHAAYCRRMMLSGFSGEGSTSDVLFPGRTEVVRIRYNQVSPDYFETAGTRLLAGRAFTRADTAGSTPVALVSRTMARQFWPGQDPVGRWVRVNNIETRIVGVVEDAIIADIHEAPEPFLYVPLVQMPTGEVTFLVETSGEPPGLMDAVKREIRAVQPAAPVFMTTSMKQHVREALYGDWLPAVLSAAIGLLGMALAAAGLFGVMLHTVNRSLRELGVRMALGASAANLLASVLRRACVLAGSGAVLGVALSFPAGRLISGMLYGVSPYDPAIATLSVVIVLTVALAAGLYPAWKAARVDPAAVLRQQ